MATGARAVPRAHLVDEVLQVLVGQVLPGADDLVEICVHELVHQVDVAKVRDLAVRRPHDVPQPDDILVLQVPQQLHLQNAAAARCPPPDVICIVWSDDKVWVSAAVCDATQHHMYLAQGAPGDDGVLKHGTDLLDGYLQNVVHDTSSHASS